MSRPIPIFQFVFAAYYATSYICEEDEEIRLPEVVRPAERPAPAASAEAGKAEARKPRPIYILKKVPEASFD
jgi:hypothetical protein